MWSVHDVALSFPQAARPHPVSLRPASPASPWVPLSQWKSAFAALSTKATGCEEESANVAVVRAGEQCLLFPTYAYRSPDIEHFGAWKVKVNGWCYSNKGAGSRTQKIAMGLLMRVLGVPKNDTTGARELLQSRAAMFLAENACRTEITVGTAGLASLDEFYAKPVGDSAPPAETAATTQPSETPHSRLAEKFLAMSASAGKQQSSEAADVEGLEIRANGHFEAALMVREEVVQRWSEKGTTFLGRKLLRLKASGPQLQTQTFGYADLVEPEGVSVISDIDDTIKETNVSLGKRVVLNNTFLMEAREIAGMANVYSHWWSRGFAMHYVSNSPYQLLPMLDAFFRYHGFPPGSAHLKVFDWRGPSRTSILSKSELGKRRHILSIMKDFPKRKFILVGDSGERDLELYTQIARENPGRVLKIFIHDVTTPHLRRHMQEEARAASGASQRRSFPLRLASLEAMGQKTKLKSSSMTVSSPPSGEKSPGKDYVDFAPLERCASPENFPEKVPRRRDPPVVSFSTSSSPSQPPPTKILPIGHRRRSLTDPLRGLQLTEIIPSEPTKSGTTLGQPLAAVDTNFLAPPAGVPPSSVTVPQVEGETGGRVVESVIPSVSQDSEFDDTHCSRHAPAVSPAPPEPNRARSLTNLLEAFARRVAEATGELPEGLCTLFEDSEQLLLDEYLRIRLKEHCSSGNVYDAT